MITDSASSYEAVMEQYFSDSHCHISPTENHPSTHSKAIPATTTAEPVPKSELDKPIIVVCGTSEEDWGMIDSLLSSPSATLSERHIIGGFGIHPWWAHTVNAGTYDRLRQLLIKHPSAIVAEIGVDTVRFSPKPQHSQEREGAEPETDDKCRCCDSKSAMADDDQADHDPMQLQVKVFHRQMALAAELRRPVSLHIVGRGSYGVVSDYVEKIAAHNKEVIASLATDAPIGEGMPPTTAFIQLPPAFLFHGYTGSIDFAKRFMCSFVLGGRMMKSLSSSVKASYPHPDCFFGIGHNTSLTSKNTRAVVSDVFSKDSTTPPPHVDLNSAPHHSLISQSDVNRLTHLPPTSILLESDAYYVMSTDAGHPPSNVLCDSEASKVERSKVAEVATVLAGGDSVSQVRMVLSSCTVNLRVALRSVLHK